MGSGPVVKASGPRSGVERSRRIGTYFEGAKKCGTRVGGGVAG